MSETRYIISDAAKMIDVEPHVLRYWEEELGMEIPRNEMGHRYYTDKEVRLFTMVRDLKDKGFQLKAIKMILSAIDSEENSNKIISLEEIRRNYENAQKQENEATLKENSMNSDIQSKDTRQPQTNSGTAKNASTVKFSQNTAGKTSDGNQSKMTEHKDVMQSKSQSEDTGQMIVNEDNENHNEATGLMAARNMSDVAVPLTSEEKMAHFKYMMDSIVMQALKKNNQTLETQISDQLSERIISEMDMLLKMQEEREEERYRNIDEMIRQRQQGYREAAAAKAPAFSSKKEKKKWFKNREF